MVDWRFYGRGEELAKLEGILQLKSRSRGFGAIRIVGRRGIGKTELLAEVGRRGTRDVPVIVFEIPSTGGADQAVTDLEAEIAREGMGHLLAEMPSEQWDRDAGWRFFRIIHHLICKGSVVGLDEFHNAEQARLITPVKKLIDEFNSIGGCKPCGKLVLTGSHQQHMLRLFQADQPLYGRTDETVKLGQWPVATVLEMAAEQNLLAPFGRFLTLWTAYGGHPKYWRRFAAGASENRVLLRNFRAWPDDRRWREAFLEAELSLLRSDPEERYDNRAFIELAAPHRDVLLWLAQFKPKGAETKEFPKELRQRSSPTLLESLTALEQHLELVERDVEFLGRAERWRVADNNVVFQINAMQEPQRASGGRRSAGPLAAPDADIALRRMETLEGNALERLAAGWLAGLSGVTWTGSGNWRRGMPDIDAMAVRGAAPDQILVLAGCKRNANAHDAALLERQFEEFLAATGESEQARQLRGMPRRKFLISPEFKAEQRDRFAGGNFECLDIRDFAQCARKSIGARNGDR